MVRYLFYTIGDFTYQSPLVNVLYSPVLDTAIAARSFARSKADTCVFNITKELMLHSFHIPNTLTKTEARITHSVQQ